MNLGRAVRATKDLKVAVEEVLCVRRCPCSFQTFSTSVPGWSSEETNIVQGAQKKGAEPGEGRPGRGAPGWAFAKMQGRRVGGPGRLVSCRRRAGNRPWIVLLSPYCQPFERLSSVERFSRRWEHQERKWRDLAGHERETGQCLRPASGLFKGLLVSVEMGDCAR